MPRPLQIFSQSDYLIQIVTLFFSWHICNTILIQYELGLCFYLFFPYAPYFETVINRENGQQPLKTINLSQIALKLFVSYLGGLIICSNHIG